MFGVCNSEIPENAVHDYQPNFAFKLSQVECSSFERICSEQLEVQTIKLPK